MKKTVSVILCLVLMITHCANFSFALTVSDINTDSDNLNLDYDALFEEAFIINGSWKSTDLKSGKNLTFYFRGEDITEKYNSARHFTNFSAAYDYYISQNPDILENLPVFIFAPGEYEKITVRFSALILGANAGINPNADVEWTLDAMKDGVPANPDRKNETVFKAGLERWTRTSNADAKWAKLLEDTEAAAGKKANIKFIIDGVKITGSVGISQYDYSNREYTDVFLDGAPYPLHPTGNRTTLTALINSSVDSFTGSGINALFSARCNSMNKNDAMLKNVRLTNLNLPTTANFLFNKFFRNVTIDGVYFANSKATLFGSDMKDASFAGSHDNETAVYDQNIEVKNSVFYKNSAIHPISLGNEKAGAGYTKMVANIHHNFFYDAVYFEEEKDYWGIFLANSAKAGVDYTYNITDNIFHQQSTNLITLFNGNRNYQKSKTTINFNRNKVTGKIECIYPNTNWSSEADKNYVSTSIFYDFSNNFHAFSKDDFSERPDWLYPPKAALANGYDYTLAPFYIDYDLSINSDDFGIVSVSGLGNNVQINGINVTADCSGLSGKRTPIITTNGTSAAEIFKDADCTEKITTVDLSKIEKGESYYIKITSGNFKVIGKLHVHTGKYSDVNSVSQINEKNFNFPVVHVNTDGGAPIVDKENYVDCQVSISNTASEFCLADTKAGIRYRGNSTFSAADKKPYRIKFDKKQDLFGIGKAKSWVLLANAFDKTMVRNTIAFAIGQTLGLEFTSEFQYVNLYLNGKFQGLYLLCEQTQTGSTRVDVQESETGRIDTGYLVEMAGNGDPDEDRYFNIEEVPEEELAEGVKSNWRIDTIKGYLKTPELEFCTDSQVSFISNYVNDANYAILTKNWEEFNRLCDVESFAKYFITSTVLNNGDGGYQIYTYKRENGGKLYAGPLWDFDQSSAATIQCGETYDKWYTGSPHPWFDSFSTWPEFLKLAKSIYVENRDEIQQIITYYTKEFYPENSYDFHANDILWNSVESDYWRITETIKTLKSYSTNFAHLSEWFKSRISWLDNAYKTVIITPETITLSKTSVILQKNENLTLTASVLPTYCDEYDVIWQSSDPNVATVQNGSITALRDGTAIITVSVSGTDVIAKCTVTVCANHKYDNNCDSECNVCKAKRNITHKYDGPCDSECNICKTTRSITHKFGGYVYNNNATAEKDGTKTRVCSECKKSETVTAVGTKWKNPFTDVKSGAYYYAPVLWAVNKGITSGTSATTFSPSETCTRAQVVSFLWRAAGKPSPKSANNPFTDVKKGAYYYEAVLWAVENGITAGVSNTSFAPNAECTRGQIVAFLWRSQGSPKVASNNPFTDVKKGSYYYDAVLWAVKNNITSGVSAKSFAPNDPCTRGQIVSFLYRCLNK